VAEIGSGGWLHALASVRRAGFGGETLVVGAPAHARASSGPSVRWIDAPLGASPQSKRLEGFRAAGSERIASLSEDYQVTAAWLEAACTASFDVTSGPVEVAADAGYFDRAAWMWEYAHLPGPEQAGPIEGAERAWVPAGNVVYRREALPLADIAGAASEMEAHQALAAAGLSFGRDPSLRAQYSPPSLGRFLADRRRWSRESARKRPSLLRALALPPVLLLRQLRHWAGRSGWRLRFVLSIPTFVVFACVQALGELEAALGLQEEA